MRLFRTLLTVLLAVAWMPLTAHCQLERATGLEFLSCSTAGEAGADAGSHCDGTACCGLESEQYQLPPSQPLISPPDLTVVLLASLVTPETELPARLAAVSLITTPLPGPRPWQFHTRAALPVRAPSFAS
jgi:hypothetical protein